MKILERMEVELSGKEFCTENERNDYLRKKIRDMGYMITSTLVSTSVKEVNRNEEGLVTGFSWTPDLFYWGYVENLNIGDEEQLDFRINLIAKKDNTLPRNYQAIIEIYRDNKEGE